jgi:DNA-binding transcriptional ArsR family regulator
MYNISGVLAMKKGLSKTCHRFFTVLSNPTRLATLETLMDGPRNVTQMAEILGQEQSMVSHNLKPLVECRFVDVEREGKRRGYSVNRATVEPLFKLVENHAARFCPTGGKCLFRGDG